MKITDQTLMVTVENTIKVGKNKELELLVEHQICGYTDYMGNVKCSVDLVDVRDIVFNGKDQGDDDFAWFMRKLREMGLHYDDEADKAMDNLIPDSLVEAVKRRYEAVLKMNPLEVYAVEEEK
tara:strand:- start:455 stop:823 length:369 start_codon:yes stop_codon:yes gene_type:complete